MKPPQFDYFAPTTVGDVVSLLGQYGSDAKVLAGGQSLMPLLNMRLARPQVLIDINGVAGLDQVRSEDGHLAVGALVRHRAVETASLVRQRCPVLARAAAEVGDPHVRNRGTFGGSVAHADPAAQLCSVVATLGGSIVAEGPGGRRTIPAESFFVGPLTTALAPDELVTDVRLPALESSGWSFRSLTPRHGDFAIAGVVVTLESNRAGACTLARLGMFGVGPTPLRAKQAESALVSERLGTPLFRQVATLAASEADPESSLNASAEYRRSMVRYLMEWALEDAWRKLDSAPNGQAT